MTEPATALTWLGAITLTRPGNAPRGAASRYRRPLRL